MVRFSTTILQFAEKGEKTGWSYIEIPVEIAQQLKPGNKKSFRVKGRLDAYRFEGISLLPMGGGSFIMALNGTVRKNIHKGKGAMLQVHLEIDPKALKPPSWFMDCLDDEPKARTFFNSLAKSHQNYFIKWVESAKTEPTKAKRMAQIVSACSKGLGFGEMLRISKLAN